MFRTVTAVTTALLLTCGLWGCGMGDDGPSFDKNDAAVRFDISTPNKTVPKPTIDSPGTSACTDTIPLQGWAQPKTTVLVTGGASDTSTDPDGVSGRFCVDVSLRKNTVNTLKVYAHDPVLGVSEPASVQISHTKCGDDVKDPPKDPPKSKNVALGVKPTASKAAEAGNEGFLTDGDVTTVTQYAGGGPWIAADIWVMIKLDKLIEVKKVVVKWKNQAGGTETDYAKDYKVLLATGTPGDPDLKNGLWTIMREITAGDGGIDTHDFSSQKPLAQYVALWLRYDGSSSWSETFSIADIEVWDVPQTTPVTPGPTVKTCANIGTGN